MGCSLIMISVWIVFENCDRRLEYKWFVISDNIKL